MKLFKSIAVAGLSLNLLASAQNDPIPSNAGILMLDDGSTRNAFIVGASKTNIFFLERERDTKPESVRRSQVEGIYFMEPSDFKEAMALLKDRKYGEASKKFAEVRERYKKLELITDNYHALAGYYQLECLRKQMDIPALAKAVADYGTPELLRQNHRTQLEAYTFWEAVAAEAWGRIERTAKAWDGKRLPVGVRAQVAYCNGLALEKLNKPMEAIGRIPMETNSKTPTTKKMKTITTAIKPPNLPFGAKMWPKKPLRPFS